MLSSSLPVPLVPASAELPSPFTRASMATSIELPKLRIPIEAARQQQETRDSYEEPYRRFNTIGYDAAPPVPVRTEPLSTAMQSIHGPTTRSPSSPASFFTQPEIAKLALTPLFEAVEQVRPLTAPASPPRFGPYIPLKRELSQTHSLPSIMNAVGGYPLDTLAMPKKARFNPNFDLVQSSNSLLSHNTRQAMIHPSVLQQQAQHLPYHQLNEQHAPSYVPITEGESHSMAGSKSLSAHRLLAYLGTSVWEVVRNTGKFPTDTCLGEIGSGGGAYQIASANLNEIQSSSDDVIDSEVKQDQWPVVEEEHTSMLIQADAVLPIDASTRQLVTNHLQSKTMRFNKMSPSPCGSVNQEKERVNSRDESFNPLSLKSIMNNEPSATPCFDVHDAVETIAESNLIQQSPSVKIVEGTKESTQRVLKRSDYSQHGMVRSGRWSVEEENYAKAMIEAFKAGNLPLHGNVSLRKFLSEVLVCHPMRISKKFVGYVRKYHWYRIAAGKCNPEAKRQILYQLSHLERVFWTSLQQPFQSLS